MDDLLDNLLGSEDIGCCIKTRTKKVVMQNRICRDICGDEIGNVCTKGCMELFAKDNAQQWNATSNRLYNNGRINGGFYDIVLLSSKHHIICFIRALDELHKMGVDFYKDKGLTKREFEVISLVIKGLSNDQICDHLSISKYTLRTHLNNTYNKVRDFGEMPKFIPVNRLT